MVCTVECVPVFLREYRGERDARPDHVIEAELVDVVVARGVAHCGRQAHVMKTAYSVPPGKS